MKRRNALSSFHPGLLTPRQQRAHYGRVPYNRRVAAMIRKYRGRPSKAEEKQLTRLQRSARGSFKGKKKLEDIFHEVYGSENPMAKKHYPAGIPFIYWGPFKTIEQARKAKAKISPDLAPTIILNQRPGKASTWSVMYHDPARWGKNPRKIPAVTPEAEKLFRKLARLNTMQKKKRRKAKTGKRRRSRKGKLPAGLRRYMAAKRRAKQNRRRRRTVNPKVKAFRKRRKAASSRRRRRAAVKRSPRVIRPPFSMTAVQLKKYARKIARLTGKRVVIKRP